MEPPPKDNTQTEEDDTIALKKKRARRVSFADNEITSVHVFRRDDSSPSSDAPPNPSILGFFRHSPCDSDDDHRHANSFLRPTASPSPGGSSTADDTDRDEEEEDDDDDFHGPVSACFIRPDRLSDSGVSDDVTMDSTAFSLHYRSLARSDSGDIKTRQFGLTTPSPQGSFMDINAGKFGLRSPTPQGNFMDLTEPKMPCEVLAGDVESCGRDSNDMSIEGEREYERISPVLNLDAILAVGSKDTSPNLLKAGCNLESSVASQVKQVHHLQAFDSEIKELEEFAKDAAVPICRQLDFANDMHQCLISRDDQAIQSSRNISKASQNEETWHGERDEESIKLITAYNSSNLKNLKSVKSGLGKAIECNSEPPANKLELSGLGNNKQPTSPLDIVYISSNLKNHKSVRSGLEQAIECNSEPPANKLELSGLGNNEQPNSPLDIAQNASNNTLAEFPSNRIPVLSTPIQEVTTQLHSLHDPPSIEDLFPKRSSDGHGLDKNYNAVLQVAQSPLTKSGDEISSGKKRKGFEILSDGDNIDKIGRIDKSPEVHKNENGDLELVLKQTGYMRSEREKIGDQMCHDWDLILKKFLDSTNQLLPPSVDKLNLRSIDRLEDILVHLQKVKKVGILCSEIHSQQKLTDPLSIPRDKRVVEMRLLLYNIAHENAKLQLMHMKQDRLKKKIQQLSFGLQESEVLRLTFPPSSSKSGAMDIQANDSHIHTTLSSSKRKCQVSCEKVKEMRQELETLDSKAKPICEFLHRYCKMEGDQSYANTMKVVCGCLQKRMLWKSITQNLKLWDIYDFERKDGHYKVALNYRDYITQMFAVNTGLPSITISNKLNDVNIAKVFPNMDVLTAFLFVLNPHTTKNCTGSSSMAAMGRETQKTSSLLSNLLDVIEEVQSAQIEIRNLVEAKFYSHSVQRLDLVVSFLDSYDGRKVKVILDMACLQCGAYPAEVIPSQMCDNSCGQQKPLPSSLEEEIRSAAGSMRVGYSRIIRLCRCISQAILSCTPTT